MSEGGCDWLDPVSDGILDAGSDVEGSEKALCETIGADSAGADFAGAVLDLAAAFCFGANGPLRREPGAAWPEGFPKRNDGAGTA